MPTLPNLSADVERRLQLTWRELVEKWEFDGAHARWHELERTRLKRDTSWEPPEECRHPNYDEFRVDAIGVTPTVALASARFEDLAQQFLKVWTQQADARCELFGEYLEAIKESVRTDVAQLWKLLGDWHSEWYDRACAKKVEDALADLVKKWASKCRTLERQRLENPMLSLADLVDARGDVNQAAVLQRSKEAYKGAEEVLERYRASQEQQEQGLRSSHSVRQSRDDLNVLLADLNQHKDALQGEFQKIVDHIMYRRRGSSANPSLPVAQNKPIEAMAASPGITPVNGLDAQGKDPESETPSPTSPNSGRAEAEDTPARGSVGNREERRAVIRAYQLECKAAGVKVTYEDIAKEANPNWADRTPIDKWVAGIDQRYTNPKVDRLIRGVLLRKPHLARSASAT